MASGVTHIHAHTHTDFPDKINFKKPGVRQPVTRAPGLKSRVLLLLNNGIAHTLEKSRVLLLLNNGIAHTLEKSRVLLLLNNGIAHTLVIIEN